MKVTHTLIALLALVSAASAQTTTKWFYGNSNNSATFGVTADSSSAIDWQDGWASELTPTNNNFGGGSIQTNRPSTLGSNESVAMFGFGGTGLNSADVTAASLYFVQDFGHAVTWNIIGLPSGDSVWDTASMSWNDINGAGAGDWTGGTLGTAAAAGLSFGSFATSGLGVDANVNVDITSAFKAYLDGTIGGIAFVNLSNGSSLTAADQRLVMFSDDNATAALRPGLLVTQAIPEPSASLLGLLGVVGLLTRRKRN